MPRIFRDSDYGPLRWRQLNHDAVNLTLDIGLLSVLQTSIWYFSITFNNWKIIILLLLLYFSYMAAMESRCRESAGNLTLDLWDVGNRIMMPWIWLWTKAFYPCCEHTIGCHTVNVNYYYLIILNFNNWKYYNII